MNLIKKYKYFTGLYLVFFLFIIISSIIKVPYDIISPAGINEVENVIEIDTDNEQSGSFNTVSVYSYDKVSLLTYIMALFDRKTTISKTYKVSNLSNALSYKSGTIQKEVSITNALIAGYNLAKMYGYDVDIKYNYKGYIVDQYYTYMTPNTIQIGDIVTSINEYSLNDYPISAALSKAEENDKDGLLFKVLRNDQELEFTLTRNEYINYYGQKSSGYGLSGYDYYVIESSNPTYTLNEANTLGPSGGLLQALSVFNALTNRFDITNGLKIVGTGTISLDGNVGAIGGIYQKVICADIMDADIFLVPVYRRNGYTEDYIKISVNNTWKIGSYDTNILATSDNIPYINKGTWHIGNFDTNYSAYGSIITINDESNIDNESNYLEAYRAYKDLKNPTMKFVPVSTLREAVNYLLIEQGKLDEVKQAESAYNLYKFNKHQDIEINEWLDLIKEVA